MGGPVNRVALACEPYGLFSVILNKTAASKQDRATYYVAAVTLEGRRKYELSKRYRDFDQLMATLTDRFAHLMRGGASGGNVPTLPPKKSFTKLNPEFFEGRTLELHQFIQDLIAIPQIAASEEMCEFLQFQNYFD